jgi:predicted nucleic-acid-binding protein
VFTSFYKKSKNEVIKILSDVLSMSFIEFTERKIIVDAIAMFKDNNLEFEDCFNIEYAKDNKSSDFATFDGKIINILKK